jgi:hypothetical protein
LRVEITVGIACRSVFGLFLHFDRVYFQRNTHDCLALIVAHGLPRGPGAALLIARIVGLAHKHMQYFHRTQSVISCSAQPHLPTRRSWSLPSGPEISQLKQSSTNLHGALMQLPLAWRRLPRRLIEHGKKCSETKLREHEFTELQ